jgi:hypothetical protein
MVASCWGRMVVSSAPIPTQGSASNFDGMAVSSAARAAVGAAVCNRATVKHVPQGMTNFFRAFYYMKSADLPGNQNLQPMHAVRTAKDAAKQNARMPEYYVMRRGKSMPATVAAVMPDAAYIKACKWLTEPECEVYGQEYMRSGRTGALQEYRRRRDNEFAPTVAEQLTFSGRMIEVRHTPSWVDKTGPPTARCEEL